MNNPLLDFTGLPRFDAIRSEHVGPALDTLLADADAALARATGDAVPAEYEALSLREVLHPFQQPLGVVIPFHQDDGSFSTRRLHGSGKIFVRLRR